MSTLSVPLTPELEETLNQLVAKGIASNKAEAARKAIALFAEEEAIAAVLKSEEEVTQGKGLKGDLEDLLKLFP